jgi:hypothetical protein
VRFSASDSSSLPSPSQPEDASAACRPLRTWVRECRLSRTGADEAAAGWVTAEQPKGTWQGPPAQVAALILLRHGNESREGNS